jgi:hypothetical protein
MEAQREGRTALVDERKREAGALVALQAERAQAAAKGRQIETEAAPIRYAAAVFGVNDQETAIRWLILMMTLCCDPFAIRVDGRGVRIPCCASVLARERQVFSSERTPHKTVLDQLQRLAHNTDKQPHEDLRLSRRHLFLCRVFRCRTQTQISLKNTRARPTAEWTFGPSWRSMKRRASLPPERAQAARLAFDARRWYASKVAPRRYGDRVDVRAEVSGANGGPITFAVLLSQALERPEVIGLFDDEELAFMQERIVPKLLAPAASLAAHASAAGSSASAAQTIDGTCTELDPTDTAAED